MTIRVLIEVPDGKIGKLLTQLTGYKALCEHVSQHDDVKASPEKANGVKKYGSPGDIMSLGDKSATKGSNREKILVTLEKLEKKNGIGTVTRKMLREECARKDQDPQIIYQLLREGYMKVLS